MSVLLYLPNELCYDIMTKWINHSEDFYLSLLLIDTAVRVNSELRLLLLNHFKFFKYFRMQYHLSRIDFKRDEGYSYDIVERFCDVIFNWKMRLQVEGVHPSVKSVSSYRCRVAEDIQKAVQLVNYCQGVKEIAFSSDEVLIGLSQHILYGLNSIQIISDESIENLTGFEQIKLHCRQLTTFDIYSHRSIKNDTLRQVLNEIVVNNPNLETIGIFSNNDIFKILINGIYTQLLEISLEIKEKVSVSRIFKIINKYSDLHDCTINSESYKFSWFNDRYNNSFNVGWIFHELSDQLLRDAIEYTAETTTSIEIESVNALSSCLLNRFHKLNSLDIQCMVDDIDWMKTAQCFPLTLNKLKLNGETAVSVIVAALKCCRSLTRCDFKRAIDDSHNDSTIVTQLRTTLLEYPDCLAVLNISFGLPSGIMEYRNREITVCDNFKHYLNAEKRIELGHHFWLEKL